MKTEIKVGIFVVVGLLSLFFVTFQIRSLEKLKKHGYVVYAEVLDASGLNIKSKVKLRGVKIGYIEDMKLEDDKVLLSLLIKNGVKIPVGSKVSVAQDNILGGKYLKIIPSSSKEYYKPGSIIKGYFKVASMEDVMTNVNLAVNDIRVLIKKLNNTLDKNTTQNIKETIKYLKLSSVKLNNILNNVDKKLPDIMKNANDMLISYKQTGDILKVKLPKLLNKVDMLLSNSNNFITTAKTKVSTLADEYTTLGKNLNDLVAKNKKSLTDTIKSAKNFFKNGSSSFKKIDDYLTSLNKSELVVDINTRYLLNDGEYNTIANIMYKPNPTKYYILGISTRNDYSSIYSDNKETKYYFNAEIAKRYDNLVVRGGIIESTGGVGIDYFLNHDKIKLSSEIYDFNSNNDYRGDNPHLNVYMRYLYLKHLEFLAGVDNVLNKDARNLFLGVGIKFKDNDLKPIVSGGASSLLK